LELVMLWDELVGNDPRASFQYVYHPSQINTLCRSFWGELIPN